MSEEQPNEQQIIPDDQPQSSDNIPQLVGEFEAMFASVMPQRATSIFDKMDSEHVTQFLNNLHEQEKRDADERRWRLNRQIIVLFGVSILVGLLILYLYPQDSEFAQELLRIIIGLLLGIPAGMGIENIRKRSS